MNTTKKKRRLKEEKAMQGTDCYIFEIICKRDVSELEDVELINEHGRSYGTIKTERGKRLFYGYGMTGEKRGNIRLVCGSGWGLSALLWRSPVCLFWTNPLMGWMQRTMSL